MTFYLYLYFSIVFVSIIYSMYNGAIQRLAKETFFHGAAEVGSSIIRYENPEDESIDQMIQRKYSDQEILDTKVGAERDLVVVEEEEEQDQYVSETEDFGKDFGSFNEDFGMTHSNFM